MYRRGSHSLQGAGSQNPVVLLAVEHFSKQDVASDCAGYNPGLLRCVGEIPSDFDHAARMAQLPKDGTE